MGRDLILLGIFLSVSGMTSYAREAEPQRPNVILISLDTTRADHIGAYDGVAKTPVIDRFAEESVLFENVSAACTTTLPSHVSMFTGQWPTHHGVVRNGYTVDDANRMLPEILKDAGYGTAGFSAALALSDLLGFSQGFDLWDQDSETFSGPLRANREARRAGEITDAAIDFLRKRKSETPLFLFLHYVDPHSPYDPPEPYRSLYGEIPAQVVGNNETLKNARRKAAKQPDQLPLKIDLSLAALYAGEISYMDHEVGRLLDFLKQRGIYDDALIVITADHGETFWEHSDRWSHGFATFETAVRVPLIVRYPGGDHAGTRIAHAISNIDLMPTILALVSVDLPTPIDGVDLGSLIAGNPPIRDASFSQGPLSGKKLEARARLWKNEHKPQSVRIRQWKYTRTPHRNLEGLYDLDADPFENENLLLVSAERAKEPHRRLAAALDRHLAEASPLPSRFYPRSKSSDDPGDPESAARVEMWEQLKAMGYISDEDGAEPEESEDVK